MTPRMSLLEVFAIARTSSNEDFPQDRSTGHASDAGTVDLFSPAAAQGPCSRLSSILRYRSSQRENQNRRLLVQVKFEGYVQHANIAQITVERRTTMLSSDVPAFGSCRCKEQADH